MNRKNGFTLIELLATIVILTIIALIVVPQIIKVINKAKLSAAEGSTYGLIDVAESYIANKILDPNFSNDFDNKLVFSCDSNGCSNSLGDFLQYSGQKATSGRVIIGNNGTSITIDKIVFNGFVCNKREFESKVQCKLFEDPEKDKNLGIICGDGKEEDYDNNDICYIKSIEDYKQFSKLVNDGKNFSNKTVILSKDLDLNGIDIDVIGNSKESFDGIFDGNAKTISNIKINSSVDDAGIFGYNKGQIKGLTIENVNITGTNNVGGLVGTNGGIVSDVIVSGNVTGSGNRVGGIVGYQLGSTGNVLKNSIARNMSVVGIKNVGGLAGQSNGLVSGISEHVKVTGESSSCSILYRESTTYCSSDSTVNGSVVTGNYVISIETSSLNDLYSNIINTSKNGDNDSNGYYFNYDDLLKMMIITKV